MKTKTPKKELPGTAKAKTRQRAVKVASASVRVWPRKRDALSNAETPILYCTLKLPGQKVRRLSTHRRIQVSAEQYAELILANALHPKATPKPQPAEVQLDLPPPLNGAGISEAKVES